MNRPIRTIHSELRDLAKRREALITEAKLAIVDGAKLPFAECDHPPDLWIDYFSYHFRCLLCNAVSPRYGIKPEFRMEK